MDAQVVADTLWIVIAAVLIFLMGLGFACVESGFARAKNCVNVLSKNVIVIAMATMAFWLFGFGLMFGDGNPLFGLEGIMCMGGVDNSPSTGDSYKGVYSALAWIGIPLEAKFFFHMKFAMVAASIISGAIAERMKYSAFIIFSFLMVAFVYPVVGHWVWGNGWLAAKGMFDFAGSTVVHSVGGWAALSGVLILGSRFGKYNPDGSVVVIPGHNMPLALIGVFALWVGWFGFNIGSAMSAKPELISHIAITTNMGACTGILGATFASWTILKKPGLGMTLNGCLGGLVAITASCAVVSVASAAIIGFIAGWLVVLSIMFFDRVKIDDPAGALSVHLVNGIFGTLCVGFFAEGHYLPQSVGNGLFFGGGVSLLGAQFLGVWTVALFAFLLSGIFWLALKYTIGIRVEASEELEGLDISEHNNVAYPEFVIRLTGKTFGPVPKAIGGAGADSQEGLPQPIQVFPKGDSEVQKIEAVIRPEKLPFVRDALEEIGCYGISVSQVDGHGTQKGVTQQWRGGKYKVDLLPKVKIEIIAVKAEIDKIVNAIILSAKTGSFGDGLVSICNTSCIVNIRTGKEGSADIN
ncbi:MAG: ammonium transporter [Planctomycetes bacterium]|nr:ammonium transporter [Planctomycetota bacterium]